ncbi:Hpt domain-containing protein [Tepidicella xavieri]|jgi:HPt (histidine-containing phosphotransfer) domain-containing protein|uniref:Hpt domain-containing protein n=1 Tax=Tepidicella xavieri TaxID=360241 RepID=A0A4R6UL17_9BURK|nr:Hpt domain-containing protein [Tepidicella xavieri]TDQ43924.1 Hpt domain-containing protein [Tepidicella xavieri]
MTGCLPEGLSAPEREAVSRYFEGDAQLFIAFRASCLTQFRQDFSAAEHALATADRAALRRIVHSLKSVCLTLGQADLSAQARRLEAEVPMAAWADVEAGWRRLQQGMRAAWAIPD